MWRKKLEKLREAGRYNGPADPKLSYLEELVNAGKLHAGELSPLLSGYTSKNLPDIRMLVLDVDGVLTDGGLYYGRQGEELKRFDVKDGHAINHAMKAGLEVAIISRGSTPEIVASRAEKLGIEHYSVDKTPKDDRLRDLLRRQQVDSRHCAFIGDDMNDLPAIELCGFSACPSDAAQRVKESVDALLNTPGGRGCVREFIERFTDKLEN